MSNKKTRKMLLAVGIIVIIALVVGIAWYSVSSAKGGNGNSDVTDNLVAHWAFDEGSGVTTADSAGLHSGSLKGNPVWATGKSGGAIQFDGVDDSIEVASSQDFSFLDYGLTITAWLWVEPDTSIQIDRPGVIATDYFHSSRGYTGYYVHLTSYGGNFYRIDCGFGDGDIVGGRSAQNRITKSSSEGFYKQSWNHIAVVFEGKEDIDIYINGCLVLGTYSGTGGDVSYQSHPLVIGNVMGFDRPFKGKMDEVRIYDRALSSDDIRTIYYKYL